MIKVLRFISLLLVAFAAFGVCTVSALSIHGALQLVGDVPPSMFIDVGLYSEGKIIKSASASTRLGYFDLFNVSHVGEGYSIKVSVSDEGRLDRERSVVEVPISPSGNGDKAVLVKGLRLAFIEERPRANIEMEVSSYSAAFFGPSSGLPLIYQTASTGSLPGFAVTILLLAALFFVKDRAFQGLGGAVFRPRRPQQVSVVNSRSR